MALKQHEHPWEGSELFFFRLSRQDNLLESLRLGWLDAFYWKTYGTGRFHIKYLHCQKVSWFVLFNFLCYQGLKLMVAESECHVVQLSRVWLKIIAVLFEQWWSIRKIWSSAKCRTVTVMLSNTTSDSDQFYCKVSHSTGWMNTRAYCNALQFAMHWSKRIVKRVNEYWCQELELMELQRDRTGVQTSCQNLIPNDNSTSSTLPPSPSAPITAKTVYERNVIFTWDTPPKNCGGNWRMLVNVDRIVEIYSGRALEGRAGVMYHCGHCWENPGTSESWQSAKKGPNRAPLR